jgi:hypothetical protein
MAGIARASEQGPSSAAGVRLPWAAARPEFDPKRTIKQQIAHNRIATRHNGAGAVTWVMALGGSRMSKIGSNRQFFAAPASLIFP